MSIFSLRHPIFTSHFDNWYKWRVTYEGGERFLHKYLEKFSEREDENDFRRRKCFTPIPTFAKTAINEVRNSIFQRMADVTRRNGSANYQAAVKGEKNGVDNQGRSMTSFLGQEVLAELLVIGRCGVYVDAPDTAPNTKAGDRAFKPYVYAYRAEDILSWKLSCPEKPGEFDAIILREQHTVFDTEFNLPTDTCERIRRVWIDENDGFVRVQFQTKDENFRANFPDEGEITKLQLTKIPFVLFNLGDSLMKDVANHQIALLNLWSSNVAYGLSANFPFLTLQEDGRDVGGHLRNSGNSDGTAGSSGADERRIQVGNVKGRRYDRGADRPGFIHPSSEPLDISLQMCEQLKMDVRQLISLAISDLGTRQSGLSKEMDSAGLEAGLSFIGLVLESGEREIAKHWAAYETPVKSRQKVAEITYPRRWNLKTDAQRVEEATGIYEACTKVPGKTVKKEASKLLVTALIGNQVSASKLDEIIGEIEQSNHTTSDPKLIQIAREQGLVGDETASIAFGFDEDEAEQARQDHTRRLAAIQAAQTSPDDQGGDVQGVDQSPADAKQQKKDEKAGADGLAETRVQRGDQRRA